jgi:hypothetical protein
LNLKYLFDKKLNVLKEFYGTSKVPFDQIINDAQVGYEQCFAEYPPMELEDKYEKADACKNLLGQACLSALQQILKEYLKEYIGDRGCWPEVERLLSKLKNSHVKGWLEQYKIAFRDLLGCDWDKAPTPFSVLEEIVLARNAIQHEGHIGLLNQRRDTQYKSKYPISLFSDEAFPGLISVTEDSLCLAMNAVEEFVTWLENSRPEQKYA